MLNRLVNDVEDAFSLAFVDDAEEEDEEVADCSCSR